MGLRREKNQNICIGTLKNVHCINFVCADNNSSPVTYSFFLMTNNFKKIYIYLLQTYMQIKVFFFIIIYIFLNFELKMKKTDRDPTIMKSLDPDPVTQLCP